MGEQSVSSTTNPKVTVLTLCYNNGSNLITALKAIQGQTYTNIEHFILDDCSTDDSFQHVENWVKNNEYPCRIFKNQPNLGICKSLNNLLKEATGDLIALNCDDFWEVNHLSSNIDILLENKADVIYSNPMVIESSGKFLFYYQDVLDYNGYPDKHGLLFDDEKEYKVLNNEKVIDALFYTNFLHPITMITYKKNYEKVGYFDENLPFEDYDMNFKLCENFKIIYNSQCTAKYIKYPTSYTVNPKRKQQLHEGIIHTLVKHKAFLATPTAKKKFDYALYDSCVKITQAGSYSLTRLSKLLLDNLTNKVLYFKFFGAYFSLISKRSLKQLIPAQ